MRVIIAEDSVLLRGGMARLREGRRELPGIVGFGLRLTPGTIALGLSDEAGTWILGATRSVAAVGAYAVNREALRLDRANAGGYEKAAAALDAIAARYDAVEAEVRAGQPDALRAFTAAITEQLSAEHKRWLEGSTQAEAVLGKLDGQLQRLNSQGKAAAGGNGAAAPASTRPTE